MLPNEAGGCRHQHHCFRYVWRGRPLTVLQGAEEGLYTLLTTDELLEELRSTLNKPKFEPAFVALHITAESVIALYKKHAEKVPPAEIPISALRDTKDIAILACALGGNADVIISGDKDLLSIGSYANIPILSATQFMERRTVLPSTPSPAE